ncbi:MAG: sigma-70 family RNA polymerase sigma factor [Candidatus Latescibacteria bacterium]|nr:sigma-70 family RNA polymerase sigma factor [Candidatus Latescibacterota bacterium]
MAERDLVLIRKTLEGDRNAFGDLVERYGRLVRGVIWETLRRPDEVEDLAQEVFFRAYEQLPKLRQPAKFASWLWQIATNTAIDHQRQGQRLAVSLAEQRAALSLYVRRPDEVVEERELTALMWEALDRLDPDCRRVVVLYYFEGCGQREIARFLDLPLTTVKWRLFRARNWLRDDLLNQLGRDAQVQPRTHQRLRNKVMALLPVSVVVQPQPRRWLERWMPGKYWALGTAAGLGIGGLAYFQPWAASPPSLSREAQQSQAQAHLAADPLIEWTPLKPRAGQRVHITAADLPVKEGNYAELHYIIDPWHPEDHVVPMRQEGRLWVADLEVPKEAVAVFYYLSPQREEAQKLDNDVSTLAIQKGLKRYRHSLLVHDDQGALVWGAAHTRAMMSQRQGREPEEILAGTDREIALHPENFNTYLTRWMTLLGEGTPAPEVLAQIRAEQQALWAKYPDQPEVLWWMAQVPTAWRDSLTQELCRRFPEYERADEMAYQQAARHFYLDQDTTGQAGAMEKFLRRFLSSRYADEAYRHWLSALGRVAPDRAARLADSLIARTLVVPYDPQKEQDQRSNLGIIGGTLPEGYAYSLRFELYLKEGKVPEALALGPRLAASGLRDPFPYLYLGQKLAGQESRALFYGDPPIYPRDLPLAILVLEAGLGWTTSENLLELPGFNTYYAEPEAGRAKQRQRYLDQARAFRQAFLQALAQCHLSTEAYAQAARYLEESAALSATANHYGRIGDQTFVLLGKAYAHLGSWDQAEQAYLQAVAQDYSHPEAETALRRMHLERYGDLHQLQQQLRELCPQAPEFALADTMGQTVRLADFQGKVLLLYYDSYGIPESTPGEAAKMLERVRGWATSSRKQGLGILHVSRSPQHRHSPFRLVLDDDSLGDKLQLRTTAVLLIDRTGRLRLRREYWPDEKQVAGWNRQVEKKIGELVRENAPTLQIATAPNP